MIRSFFVKVASVLVVACTAGVVSKARGEENLYTSKCSPAAPNTFVAEKVRALILHPEAVRDVESARRILGIPLELSAEKRNGITAYVSHGGFSGWCGVVFYKYDGVVDGSFATFGNYSTQLHIYMEFRNGEMRSSDFYSMMNADAISATILSSGWTSFPEDQWSPELIPPNMRRALSTVDLEEAQKFKSFAVMDASGQVKYGVLMDSPIFVKAYRGKYKNEPCDRNGLCSFSFSLAAAR